MTRPINKNHTYGVPEGVNTRILNGMIYGKDDGVCISCGRTKKYSREDMCSKCKKRYYGK